MKRLSILCFALLCATTVAWSQAKASLTIMCNVPGAQIFLAGQMVGTTVVPNIVFTVRQGSFPLKIALKGYNTFDTNVVIGAAGTTVQVNLTPTGAAAPPPPPPVAANYALTIQANVGGADVFINGNLSGKVPFAAQVPNGSYAVTVKAAGFLDFNQNVVVNGGPFTVNAVLQSQNQQLSVQSNVAGAIVYINGNAAGKTPFASQVPAGSYSVQVKAPGYADFNQNIVVGNAPAAVNAVLQALTFQLNVGANVQGAVVLLNGGQAGQTPFATQLPQGSYTVTVRAPGYNDYQAQVTMNGPQAVNAVLQPMVATWQLRLPDALLNKDIKTGQSRGIQVWIDGVQQAEALGPIAAAGQLLPGRHVVRLVSGGLAIETTIEAQAGKAYTFEPVMGLSVK